MAYYHLPTSTERNPRSIEIKLSDGAKLGPPDSGWTDTLAALCGFIPIIDTIRPSDTSTHTFDRSVGLPGGIPTVVWTQRLKTALELEADIDNATAATLDAQARSAYTANRTYLAISTPTNAQVVSQVRLLTKQCQGFIRLLLARDLLDETID